VHRPSVTESEIKDQTNSEMTHPASEEPVEDSSQKLPEVAREEEREVEEVTQLETEAYVPQVVPDVVKEEQKPQYSAWDASRSVPHILKKVSN